MRCGTAGWNRDCSDREVVKPALLARYEIRFTRFSDAKNNDAHGARITSTMVMRAGKSMRRPCVKHERYASRTTRHEPRATIHELKDASR